VVFRKGGVASISPHPKMVLSMSLEKKNNEMKKGQKERTAKQEIGGDPRKKEGGKVHASNKFEERFLRSQKKGSPGE